jgi:hypothetical protein
VEHGLFLHDREIGSPPAFFQRIIRDFPADVWIRVLQGNPTLRNAVLEGFTVGAQKLGLLMHQTHLVVRLRRFLYANSAVLVDILKLWGQEQLASVAKKRQIFEFIHAH